LALGRYSEAHGPQGLNSDLLNRAFEIVPKSRADFGKLDATTRELCRAFVAGINYYLVKNPQVQPRLIKTFEPWHVLAFQRQIGLELCFRYTHLSSSYLLQRLGDRRQPHRQRRTHAHGQSAPALLWVCAAL
jgi:acyl-homoserine lactone acylase PvdQ